LEEKKYIAINAGVRARNLFSSYTEKRIKATRIYREPREHQKGGGREVNLSNPEDEYILAHGTKVCQKELLGGREKSAAESRNAETNR